MTKVINFFAGPGAGKSSSAYVLAGIMKWRQISCELVTEYAKDLVWQNSLEVLQNQIYVFSKQYQKMYRLQNKVDYIITDSPLLLSLYYDKNTTKGLESIVLETMEKFENINFFISREKPYWKEGRLQTEQEAVEIDKEVLRLLDRYHQDYTTVRGYEDNWMEILKNIKGE